MQAQRPVLRVAHGGEGVEPALQGLQHGAQQAEALRLRLILARHGAEDLGQHGAGRLPCGLGLHRGVGAHQFELLDAVQVTPLFLVPGGAYPGERLEGAPEALLALARRGRHAAHEARALGEQGDDDVGLAQLLRGQDVGLVGAVPQTSPLGRELPKREMLTERRRRSPSVLPGV